MAFPTTGTPPIFNPRYQDIAQHHFHSAGHYWYPLFFFLAHLISLLGGNTRLDGYGFVYESLTAYGAVFIGVLSLVILYRIARLFLARAPAVFAVIGMFYASNAIYYATIQSSMSHVAGLFCVSGAVYCWLQSNLSLKKKYVFWCGTFVALAIFVRPQLALIGILMLAQLIVKSRSLRFVSPLALAMGAAVFIQLVVWKIIFGSFILIPQGQSFLTPFSPHIFEVLFSLKHGLFTWHPIYLIALVGLGFFRFANLSASVLVAILVAIVSQIYLNSIVTDWWAGNSFGNRRFVDLLPLFFLGLIFLMKAIPKSWKMNVVIVLLIVWNFLFVVQYRFGFIPRGEAITFQQLTFDKFTLYGVRRKY